MSDLISRQDAKLKVARVTWEYSDSFYQFHDKCVDCLDDVPSAQPERDIPMKPMETTDMTWGIPFRQAVCPKCDYYLSNVVFLGDGKGNRVTYCEHCGQAIDWEGWDVDDRSN